MSEPDEKPNRRDLLRGVAAGAAGLGLPVAAKGDVPPATPRWMKTLGPGVADKPYGLPSPFEAEVVRRIDPALTAARESSISFTPLGDLDGTITPNGLHFERHHAGVPAIDPALHRLMVHGMVERELIFTLDDLKRFPRTTRTHFIECAGNSGMEWRGARMSTVQFTHGMISNCEWTGVRLATLLNEAGVRPEAKWILAEGADAAAMTRSIPLAKALEDSLLVLAQNGEALRPEQGYPLRLLVPGWEGNVSIKWLRRLKLGDEPWQHREETSRYTLLMPDGKARQFAFVQEVNSVITAPCPEHPLRHGPGPYEVSGLAWSGRGRIKRVDLSTDGGTTWRTARLQAPVLSRAVTRFRFAWAWNGREALLQSRALDETGALQPDAAALKAERGLNSAYHRNAIQTWRLAPDGKVDNVQLG